MSPDEICYENSNSGSDTDCSACYPVNAQDYILNTMLSNQEANKYYVDKIDTHWGYISKQNAHDIVDAKTSGSEQQQCERIKLVQLEFLRLQRSKIVTGIGLLLNQVKKTVLLDG